MACVVTSPFLQLSRVVLITKSNKASVFSSLIVNPPPVTQQTHLLHETSHLNQSVFDIGNDVSIGMFSVLTALGVCSGNIWSKLQCNLCFPQTPQCSGVIADDGYHKIPYVILTRCQLFCFCRISVVGICRFIGVWCGHRQTRTEFGTFAVHLLH